jgi:hypothetical protein
MMVLASCYTRTKKCTRVNGHWVRGMATADWSILKDVSTLALGMTMSRLATAAIKILLKATNMKANGRKIIMTAKA